VQRALHYICAQMTIQDSHNEMCQHNAVTQLPGGDKPCRRSSASHRIPPCRPPTRGRFLAIGIHRAPPRIFNEFLGKMKALVAAVVALPVVQKNLLKYQTVRLDCGLLEPYTEISTLRPRYPRTARSTNTLGHLGCRLPPRSILLRS
jgi:hypothetical protein